MSNIGKSKVALVTDSSTGIGYETCLALARNSFVTCATMRDKKKSRDFGENCKERKSTNKDN